MFANDCVPHMIDAIRKSSSSAVDDLSMRGRTGVMWPQRVQAVAFYGLLAMLLWAPWPLGSNRNWAIAVLGLLVWTLVLLAAAARVGSVSTGPDLVPRNWVAGVPLAFLAGFAGLLVLQLQPGLGEDGEAISIDLFQTRKYLLTTLVYAGAWLLVVLSVTTQARAARLLGTLVAAGVMQATVAVLLYAGGAKYEFLFAAFDQGGRVTGTFVNPNHLAGYLELCLAAGMGLLLSQFSLNDAQSGSGWRAATVSVLAFMLSGKMLLRLLLVVMVIALVMTHSRMGNSAFFIALVITGAVVAWVSRRLRRPALWLVASIALVDVLIVGHWVGLDRVIQRLTNTVEQSSSSPVVFGTSQAQPPREDSLAHRLEVPLLSLQLIALRPWLGHGGGTYATAFPPIKQPGMPDQWDHAHNDFVQVACDTGLLGLLLWLGAGVLTAAQAVHLLRDGQSTIHRGVGVAAIMTLACMGLHSMVDFNLHVPANAVSFTVLLAAVWALPPKLETNRRRATNHRRQTASPAVTGTRA